MKEELRLILERGKSQYAMNKKYIATIIKRKIRYFDDDVHRMHDEVFESIDCRDCGSCCKDLGPRLNETDIDRIASTLRMKNSEFTLKFLKRDEDDDFVFTSMPCPFTADDHLCSVYEDRPRACMNYPHTDEKNIHNKLPRLLANTQYCPAVVLIVEKIKAKYG